MFGNVAVKKNLTLSQVGFWDAKEIVGVLSQGEIVAREEARVDFHT